MCAMIEKLRISSLGYAILGSLPARSAPGSPARYPRRLNRTPLPIRQSMISGIIISNKPTICKKDTLWRVSANGRKKRQRFCAAACAAKILYLVSLPATTKFRRLKRNRTIQCGFPATTKFRRLKRIVLFNRPSGHDEVSPPVGRLRASAHNLAVGGRRVDHFSAADVDAHVDRRCCCRPT